MRTTESLGVKPSNTKAATGRRTPKKLAANAFRVAASRNDLSN